MPQPDIEQYIQYFDKFDMTYEQKVEYIYSLWGIAEAFADWAFGIHPLQQVSKSEPPSMSDEVRARVAQVIDKQ